VTTPATVPAHVPEVLAALEQIPGVAAASVDGGAAEWLRLDLHDDADEAAVRAAMTDVLRTRTSAEPGEIRMQETVSTVAGDGGRLALDRLVLTTGPGVGTAEVTVALDDRTAPGSATLTRAGETADADAAVATALLLALEELTEDAVIGSVEQIEFPDGGGTASVRLRLDIDGSEVLAEAGVPVLGHRPQALARAVLAAVEPHLPA
jgi:hypothetical protein